MENKKYLAKSTIAIIGLGYVGLPLAVAFAKKYKVVGFDTNKERINSLLSFIDETAEITSEELRNSSNLQFTNSSMDLKDSDFFIVTVPTPVDVNNVPDLKPLILASESIGPQITKKSIIIYESTVFPGATEEICVPAIEKTSGLKFNKDFFVGYSPERVNPADKERKITDIIKVTSASSIKALNRINDLYKSIIKAGVFPVSSIKVAEAAKVIENAQRDLNIAFMNELSVIFHIAGINTKEVLEAASTKWNFMKFFPGLVGGHCISVDPYYLTSKAESLGYFPDLILTARRVNESVPFFIASTFLKIYLSRQNNKLNKSILIFGVTFKENCPDIRNSKIFNLRRSLEGNGFKVDIVDPCASIKEVMAEYNIPLKRSPPRKKYSGVILAVAHQNFKVKGQNYFKAFLQKNGIFMDLKSLFPKKSSDFQL